MMRCPRLNEIPPPPPGKSGWPWTEESQPLPDVMPDGLPWPRVCIVTPSYNQGQFIEETIRSVLLQGYPDLEYIIMDGGSTDQSLEIIQKYGAWIIYWVSEPDEGQADAVNKGWQRASGEILGWINSDDVYSAGAVELAVSTLAASSAIGFVYGDAQVIDASGHNISVQKSRPFDLEKLLTFYLSPSQPTVFFRHSLIEAIGLLDTSLQMSMDTDYWIRLGCVTRGLYIPQTMADMRTHSEAKTVSRYIEYFPDSLAILDKTFNDPALPKAMRTLRAKSYSRAHYGAAVRAYQAGVRRPILPQVWRSFCLYPHPFELRTYLAVLMCIEALTRTSLLEKLIAIRPRHRLIKLISNLLGRAV